LIADATGEFGPERLGHSLVVGKALCGLRSGGHAWRKLLSEVLQFELKFELTKADPDARIRSAVKPDGFERCEVVLVHVDDTPVASGDAKLIVEHLAKAFKLKPDGLGELDWRLGASTGKHQDGSVAWFALADGCAKEAVGMVERVLDRDGEGVTLKKCQTPFPSGHKPELDLSEELNKGVASQCSQAVGTPHWGVELG
jgi:hypothetical protein